MNWRFVGLTGFEPATPCPPDKCANQAALQPVLIFGRASLPEGCAGPSTLGHYLLDAVRAAGAQDRIRTLAHTDLDEGYGAVVELTSADVAGILQQGCVQGRGRARHVQPAEVGDHCIFIETWRRVVATSDSTQRERHSKSETARHVNS